MRAFSWSSCRRCEREVQATKSWRLHGVLTRCPVGVSCCDRPVVTCSLPPFTSHHAPESRSRQQLLQTGTRHLLPGGCKEQEQMTGGSHQEILVVSPSNRVAGGGRKPRRKVRAAIATRRIAPACRALSSSVGSPSWHSATLAPARRSSRPSSRHGSPTYRKSSLPPGRSCRQTRTPRTPARDDLRLLGRTPEHRRATRTWRRHADPTPGDPTGARRGRRSSHRVRFSCSH